MWCRGVWLHAKTVLFDKLFSPDHVPVLAKVLCQFQESKVLTLLYHEKRKCEPPNFHEFFIKFHREVQGMGEYLTFLFLSCRIWRVSVAESPVAEWAFFCV